MNSKLSHYDPAGKISMVDVGLKPETERTATARAYVVLNKAVLDALPANKKGDPLEVARIAGIMAAKKTSELIPLCHPLPLSHCEVNFEIPKSRDRILITASAKVAAQTGVEMEALTAVSVAALTIYDMCKAVDKKMTIGGIQLISKTKKEP